MLRAIFPPLPGWNAGPSTFALRPLANKIGMAGPELPIEPNGHGKIVWRKRIVNGRDSGGIDKGNRCRSNAISEDADTNSVGTVIDGDITAGGKHAGDHAWRNDVTSCDDAGRTGCENTAGN